MLFTFFKLLLLCAGDVKSNPGPNNQNANNKITFCHINARSIYPKTRPGNLKLTKINEILTDEFPVDILAMSETWLDHSISDIDLSACMPHFNIYRKDRENANPNSTIGGGVALFIS